MKKLTRYAGLPYLRRSWVFLSVMVLSGLYFTNTVIIDGTGYQWTTVKGSLVNMPALTGTGTMTGNTGNGQVRITPLN